MRVFFIGSGSISVPLLEALAVEAAIDLCGVATQPDRPAGRRRVPTPTPVAEFAEPRGLPLHKPASVNDPEFAATLSVLSPEVVLVFSFGQILKEGILGCPPFGCLNVHASLLPRHRGAAPVRAAILAGDAETGVSLMRMERGLDTGPVYRQWRTPLDGTETAADLSDRLARLAAETVVEGLVDVCRRCAEPTPQPDEGVTYAGQIHKGDARLDWRKPARTLEREVRAYNPWPRSWFVLPSRKGDRRIQVLGASVAGNGEDGGLRPAVGEVLPAKAGGLRVACGDAAIEIETVVPEGKGAMPATEFLRGASVSPGMVLPGPEE